jgi:hypothetical protein
MNLFNVWPERQAQLARWALIVGWLGLIVLLLVPELGGTLRLPAACAELPICRAGLGNDLFWNLGLPLVLVCVVASHELWRRICPLSFVSQLARALGVQRSVPKANGRRQLVAVGDDSWLGRHHLQLQWSLLIAGLALRILLVNSSGLALALLCLAALVGALVTGWAYSGKAWCHYICPFGPAQRVLTGPRSLLGSNAHMGSPSRTTQSMCRTVGSDGHDISTCVACTRPCFDIDAERTYWQSLSGVRGLSWAWYSYPGMILGFFLLIRTYAPPGSGVDYLRSRLFTYDARLASLAWEPLLGEGWPPIPRLVAVPLLLAAACLISQQLFQGLEGLMRRQLEPRLLSEARPTAMHRSRLLATFAAVNTYFFFKGNPFTFTGPLGDFFFQLLLVTVSSMWLYRGWHRDRSLYERESLSTSLRKQLARLGQALGDLLAGRRLDDLSPGEVFVLAKALPAQAGSERRQVYTDVLRDMLRSGRLERATALVQLAELRSSLGLEPRDHAAAIELLLHEDAGLAGLSAPELGDLALRRSAAAEEVEDLLHLTGLRVLDPEALPAHLQQRLERIRTESGLDDPAWNDVLSAFGAVSPFAERQLLSLQDTLTDLLAERRSLEQAAATEHLIQPLLLSLDQRIADYLPLLVQLLSTGLSQSALESPPADSLRLLAALPATVPAFLASEDATTLAIARWLEGHPAEPIDLEALPDAEQVLARLCNDPDPPLAAWSQAVLERRNPALAATLRDADTGLPAARPSPEASGGSIAELLASPVAQSSLISCLDPSALLQLPQLGTLRRWEAGEPLALGPTALAILLGGACEAAGLRREARPGPDQEGPTILGLLDHFGGPGTGRSLEGLRASPEGCCALVMQPGAFRQLLDVSPVLEQTLIRSLARSQGAVERSLA